MFLLFYVTCLIKKLNFTQVFVVRLETYPRGCVGSLFKYLKHHLEDSLKNKDITHNMSNLKLAVH